MAKSNRRRTRRPRPRARTPRPRLAWLATVTLLVLLAWFTYPGLLRGDRRLSVETPAPPFDTASDLQAVEHAWAGPAGEAVGTGATRHDLFVRLFEPLRDEGLALVGTCPPADESGADARDALLDAHAAALLRCIMWIGVDTGVGVTGAIDPHALAPRAADAAADLDGSMLLGLEPQYATRSATVVGLMPWWTVSGPGTLLAPGASHTGTGGDAGTVGDTGAGSGGVRWGITRGNLGLPALGGDLDDGGEPAASSRTDPGAPGERVHGPDTGVDGDEDAPSGETQQPGGQPNGPSGGPGPDPDIFPPPVVLARPPRPGAESSAPASVPEPATFLLAGAALAALMITRRTRA